MSEFFNNKDYGDYFAALESQINRSDSKPAAANRTGSSVNRTVKKSKKMSARRRAIIRRRAVIATALIVVVAIAALCISAFNKGPEAKDEVSSAPQVQQPQLTAAEDTATSKPISFKFNSGTTEIGSDFESRSIIFVNNDDKTVTAARGAREKLYPASTTKIMTLLVAAENIKDFDDTFTMTYEITDPLYMADATVAGFSAGEQVNMTDLLYGVILPSGGDACIALAEHLCGSETEFVKLMNKRARAMGLKNTRFKNSTGLHDAGHYTTAEDLSIILATTLENELCREILSTYQYTTAATPQHPEGILLSSTLFSHMYGTEPEGADILGGKTGFTGEAGYCIAAFGKSDSGTEYICVTLSGQGKWPTFYDQIDLFSAYAN